MYFWDNTDMLFGQHGHVFGATRTKSKYGQQGQKLGQGKQKQKLQQATCKTQLNGT